MQKKFRRNYRNIMMAICFLLFGGVCGAQELYVGANYHPHDDKNRQKWERDIRLMKEAGFNVVRLGHLAWDSYEPAEGQFDFEWFDTFMDMMDEARIKVILDISVRPAPIWLHQKHPSISITDTSGNRLYPNHRYMEDMGDPGYQKYALRYTDKITRRYANHPALLAFGIDNESGDGPISYSESVRWRFVEWLKKKYKTVDALNQAWAGQRWSRKLVKFDEIGLPVSGSIQGPPERTLDFRRFVSDEVNQFLFQMMDVVYTNAPGALTTTNAWYYSHKKYFDYSKIAYSGKMRRGGNGFYPGNSLVENWGLMHSLFGMARIQFENETPFWNVEFTTMTAVPKSVRKSAYAALMYGSQMICGWTWQSMHGGEEQYLEGMLDWDGVTNRTYDEYKQIATEFKKIEEYGFPYRPEADVGLAFSFPSQIVSYGYPIQHDSQMQTVFNEFYSRNIDLKVVAIDKSPLDYKLLIVPGVALMDETTANKIRDYVDNGGVVIMTGYSAFVDEHNQVFQSTRPGHLDDVFGIRIANFEDTSSLNEISRLGYKGKKLQVNYRDDNIEIESARFDVVEPKGATVLGEITSLDKDYPIVTSHKYGKGRAIYIGLAADGWVLAPILDELIDELGIRRGGPEVPRNVMARYIDDNHILFLNVSGEPQEIKLKGKSRSILLDKDYVDSFVIQPYEPDFVEWHK